MTIYHGTMWISDWIMMWQRNAALWAVRNDSDGGNVGGAGYFGDDCTASVSSAFDWGSVHSWMIYGPGVPGGTYNENWHQWYYLFYDGRADPGHHWNVSWSVANDFANLISYTQHAVRVKYWKNAHVGEVVSWRYKPNQPIGHTQIITGMLKGMPLIAQRSDDYTNQPIVDGWNFEYRHNHLHQMHLYIWQPTQKW